jgi:hypothetical protein
MLGFFYIHNITRMNCAGTFQCFYGNFPASGVDGFNNTGCVAGFCLVTCNKGELRRRTTSMFPTIFAVPVTGLYLRLRGGILPVVSPPEKRETRGG